MIDFLNSFPPLNHPIATFWAAFANITIGLFVLFKNPFNKLYRIYFLWVFLGALWFIGNGISMLNFDNFELALLSWMIGYSVVPVFSVTFYHLYLVLIGKKSLALPLLYFISVVEVVILWACAYIREGLYFLPNVGGVWNRMSDFSLLLIFGMLKYLFICLFCAYRFYLLYFREKNKFRKKQLKLYAALYLIISFGFSEWFPAFGIRQHIAWLIIPVYAFFFAYWVIRYRFMDIDTAIHRTLLWLLTVSLLIVPMATLISLFFDRLLKFSFVSRAIFFVLFSLVFLNVYNLLKPKIDHFFRRKKYDYRRALNEIPTKIGSELDLPLLIKKIFQELKSILYVRNAQLFLESRENAAFIDSGSTGYERLKEVGLVDQLKTTIAPDSRIIKFVGLKKRVLEKDNIEFQPEYEKIREEVLALFEANALEVIVPLVLKEKLIGLLGLGKKDNLRSYELRDIRLLERLGEQLSIPIDNALHHQDIIERERLAEELKLGREIQIGLLPKEFPEIEGFQISGMMEPAKEIGGDYYDFLFKSDNRVSIVIGDVSGKGVAAGLLMAVAKTAVYSAFSQGKSPKEVLISANEILYNYMGGEMFMSLLFLEYIKEEKKLIYSSAGHEYIIYYNAQEKRCIPIKSGGFVLGMLGEISSMLEQRELVLSVKDKILLYTDGVTEAENEARDKFGMARFIKAIEKNAQKPSAELLSGIYQEVREFMGAQPQYDDITLIAMEVTG